MRERERRLVRQRTGRLLRDPVRQKANDHSKNNSEKKWWQTLTLLNRKTMRAAAVLKTVAPAARGNVQLQVKYIKWDKVDQFLNDSKGKSDNGILVYADSAEMALQQGRLNRQKRFTTSGASQTLQTLRTWRGLGQNLLDSTATSVANPDSTATSDAIPERTLKDDLKVASSKAMQMCKRRRANAAGVSDTSMVSNYHNQACDDNDDQSDTGNVAGQGARRTCPLRVFAMPVCLKFDGTNTVCSLNESRTSQPTLDAAASAGDLDPASPSGQTRRKYNTSTRALNDKANNAYRALFRPVDLRIPEKPRKIIKDELNQSSMSIWNSRLQRNTSQAAADHIGRFVNHVHAVRAYVQHWPSAPSKEQVKQVVEQYEWSNISDGNIVDALSSAQDEDMRDVVIYEMLVAHLTKMKKLRSKTARKQRADRIRAWTQVDGEGLIELEGEGLVEPDEVPAAKPWETLKDAIAQGGSDLGIALQARPRRCEQISIVVSDNQAIETWGFPVTEQVKTAVLETVKLVMQGGSVDIVRRVLNRHANQERSEEARSLRNRNTTSNDSTGNDASRLDAMHALVNGNDHFVNNRDTMHRTWLASLLLLFVFRRELVRAGAASKSDLDAWSIGDFGTCVPHRLVYAFGCDLKRWRDGIVRTMRKLDAIKRATSARQVLAANWGSQRTKHVPIPTDAGFFSIMNQLDQSDRNTLLNTLQPVFEAGRDWLYSCNASRADLTSLCLATAAQVAALGNTDTTALNSGDAKTTVLETSRRIGSVVPGGSAYGVAQYTVPVTTVLSDIDTGCVPIGRAIKRVSAHCPREYRGILNGDQQKALQILRTRANDCERTFVPSDVGLVGAYHRVVQSWAAIDTRVQNQLQDQTDYKTIVPENIDGATSVFLESLRVYANLYNSVKERRAGGYWIATGAPKPHLLTSVTTAPGAANTGASVTGNSGVADSLAYKDSKIILHCVLDENVADDNTGIIRARVLARPPRPARS